MSFSPKVKNPGDIVESSEWNSTMNEVKRLEVSKQNTARQNLLVISEIQLHYSGIDICLSGRTNPNRNNTGSACRALVDFDKKLVINFNKDFEEGTYVWGNGNTLSLYGSDHCYMEFYPKGLNWNQKRAQFVNKRFGWIGYGNAANNKLTISNTPDGNKGTILIDGNLEINGNVFYRGTINPVFPSDVKLKSNIEPITDGLEKLVQLQGVSYDWIDQEKYGNSGTGFVAQEVEKVFPDWVEEGEDGIKYLKISGIEAYFVEAIKALQSEIEKLKQQLQAISHPYEETT
jgi:hypothetical protein